MITRKHALIASAFVAAGGRRALAQAALTPVHIASTANDDVTSALYALQQDMFRKAGLDVNLTTLTSGAAISAAVAGGAVDIGRSSLLPLITARSRGIGFMLIAPSGLYLASAPVAAVVTPVASPIHTARISKARSFRAPRSTISTGCPYAIGSTSTAGTQNSCSTWRCRDPPS